jgi:hypothetical protein
MDDLARRAAEQMEKDRRKRLGMYKCKSCPRRTCTGCTDASVWNAELRRIEACKDSEDRPLRIKVPRDDLFFRGRVLWDVDNGAIVRKWLYGNLVYLPGGLQLSLLDEENNLRCYCVDRGTEGRYTGVRDSWGTKVWEGDIVLYVEATGTGDCANIVDEVKYAPGRFILGKSGRPLSDFTENPAVYKYLSVLGNVHDNLEWLEADK